MTVRTLITPKHQQLIILYLVSSLEIVTHFQDGVRSREQLVLGVKKALNIQEARVMNEETRFGPREKPGKLTARYLAMDKHSYSAWWSDDVHRSWVIRLQTSPSSVMPPDLQPFRSIADLQGIATKHIFNQQNIDSHVLNQLWPSMHPAWKSVIPSSVRLR